MKTIRLYTGIILALSVTLLTTTTARAAATAFDTACNEPMVTSSNGGIGFQPWAVSIPVAGGTFLSTTSKLTGNGCTNAWGMFTGTNTTTSTSAQRLFSSANGTNSLQPGQQITVDMANGGVNTGGSQGLSLWNSASNSVWQLLFSGGSSSWTISDGSGGGTTNFNYSSGLGYNPSNGVRVVFTLTSATTYSARLSNFAGGTLSAINNTLVNPTGGRAINLLRFFTFNIGSGNNITINNIGVSCPDTLTFTTQPTTETVPTNFIAVFTADSFGDSVTYQWQSSVNAGFSWSNITGATNGYSITATNYESYFSVVATPANSFLYRSIATDACGNTATSSPAALLLTNLTAAAITTQPANTTVCNNSPATFAVTAAGTTPGYNWVQQANSGWGAGNAWSVTASNAGSGVFLGSSTNNESGTPFCTGFGNNDINSPTSGNALGLFGPAIKVLREFPSNLSVGQWFSIDMDNGNVDTGAQNGFSLHTSTANGDRILMSFYFLGGQRNYKIFDGTGEHDTGIRLTRTGLHIQITVGPTLGGTNTYVMGILTNQCGSGASITNVFSGLFETNSLPGAVLLYNNNAAGGSANDIYFNNFIAGAAYDNADNYSTRNWANGGNGGDLPISGATGSSFTINNAQSSGTYYVVVTNAVGAVVSSTATLTVNPTPALSLSETDVSCNGGNNGSVQATFSGGTGTLQVNIDGGVYSTQTSPHTFTGLSAGSHTVSVQDTKGCASNLSITVNQPSAVMISSTSQQDNTVCGAATGSITVTASGGTGTLQYSDDGGTTYQVSNQFTGLASGAYSIVVKDANGCTSTASPVTINDPNGPSFTFAQVNETCNGQSVGSITVTASGGSGSGYTYSKDNGATFQAGNQFTGLSAGSYTVVVKDGNGCTSSGQIVTITQPSAVMFTTGQANETCNGQSIGSITVTASGGSGSGYTYSMDNGATFQGGNQFTGLTAGTYQIVVKDGNGCPSSVTPITITQPAALSCLVSPSIATNCAGSTQIFTVNASGGIAGYTYSWSGPNSFIASGSSVTNNNVQPADAGTYTVTVTDANGCQSTCMATLTVNVASSITGQPTNTSVCAGSAANLTVTASGSPLNYVWRKLGSGWGGGGWVFSTTGSGSQFLGSSTDNDSGDTSSNGGNDINTAGKAWAIFNNGGVSDALRLLPGGVQVGQTFSLDMDNGSVQSGGTVGFGLQNTSSTSNRLEVFFVGGSNDYTVSDSAGGNDSGIGFTRTGIHCQITLTSVDTYSITIIRYAGSATAETNTLRGTLKGIAGTAIDQIRLFNANAGDCGFGCNNFTLYFNNIGFGCNDDNAGNYTNWAAGSDFGQGPLANGGDISGATTPTLTINPSSVGDTGSYDVFVTNSCGVAISSNAVLTVNSLPTQYGVGGGGAYCSGGSGVSVTLSNSDIGINYQLELNNSPTGSPLAGTGNAISFDNQTVAGTYTVVANNATTGCLAIMTGSATVTVNPTPSCSVSPSSAVVCAGASQTFTVNPSGGTPGYTYLWSDGSTGTSITTNAAGTYSVTVTDSKGCTTTCSATLTVTPNPTAFNVTGGGAYCSGGSGVAIGLDGSQSGVNYQLQLDAGPTGLPVAGTDGALSFGNQMAAGTYTVIASDATSGCTATMAGGATVVVNLTPSAPTAGNNGPLLAGSTLNLTASTVPSTTYSWTGPNSFASTNQNPSIANATSAANGTYNVTVTDGNGCTSAAGTTTVLVTPLRITAIVKEGNDIRVTWLTTGGTTNALQATKGTPGYNTNFVDISGPILILGAGDSTTNYVDVSGATNSPAEFYRVRLVP